ncbi:MAG: hypothetical protein ABI625_18450 [bacterium]
MSTEIPTVADVARIAEMRDRVLRNLEITECYAQLSDAMRVRTGGDANWCTFATWASRQAGVTIRGEDLLDGFKRRVGAAAGLFAPWQAINRWLLRKGLYAPESTLGRLVAVIHTPFDVFEHSSEQVAIGNRMVFEEIAREFARFLATVPADAEIDAEAFREFAAGLKAGSPPDGQDFLREAFSYYQQLRHETDVPTRAALQLLANLLIGLHEQTRLQPQIIAAVETPVTTAEELGQRVLLVLFPGAGQWPHVARRSLCTMVGWIAKGVRRGAIILTRETVTESMMVLGLPNAVLALGRNLDAPIPSTFVPVSQSMLRRFLEEHDLCGDGTGECGAADWGDLPQRMHYIVHLFRAFAHEHTLFDLPFTAEQVEQFRSGVVPDGRLSS